MIKSLTALLAAVVLCAACGKKDSSPSEPMTSETPAAPARSNIGKDLKQKTDEMSKAVKVADIYEVGCGMCIYKKPAVKRCETWVKIDNKTILPLAGDHIDAHSSGLCQEAAQADISGSFENGRLAASEAMLLSK